MIYASKTLVLAGFAIATALPGFAQEAPTTTAMTCSEFLTLDATAQAETLAALSLPAGDATMGGGASTDATGAVTAPATGTATVDPATADPTATNDGAGSSETPVEPMADGSMPTPTADPTATNDGAGSSLDPVEPMADGSMPTPTAEMTSEEEVALAVTACTTQPDMPITDALKANP